MAIKKAAAKKLSISKSGMSVAQALAKAYPKDAPKIVKIMGDAATSASMKRKLGRVQLALDALRKEEK